MTSYNVSSVVATSMLSALGGSLTELFSFSSGLAFLYGIPNDKKEALGIFNVNITWF